MLWYSDLDVLTALFFCRRGCRRAFALGAADIALLLRLLEHDVLLRHAAAPALVHHLLASPLSMPMAMAAHVEVGRPAAATSWRGVAVSAASQQLCDPSHASATPRLVLERRALPLPKVVATVTSVAAVSPTQRFPLY